MNYSITKLLLFLSFLVFPKISFSQIQQEVLNVGKKKTPGIEIKNIIKKGSNPERYPPDSVQNPIRIDSLHYSILEIPANSNFHTSVLKPEPLNLNFYNQYFENYIRLGYGNANTIMGDGYFNYPINNRLIGLKFSGLYTDGPKKKYDWKTSNSRISTEGFYITKLQTGKLHIAGNYTYSGIYYYGMGIPELFLVPSTDLKQQVNQLTLKSDYDLYSNNFLDHATLKVNRWWDHFNTHETSVNLFAQLAESNQKTSSFMIGDLNFGANAGVLINYTGTNFGLASKNKYSYLTLGFSPTLSIFDEGSYLKIGANIAYSNEMEAHNNKFFFHPNLEFLFNAEKEINAFVGIDGEVKLNNMAGFFVDNPYLYSNQILRPTNTLYKFYVGIKGDIAENFKYEGKINYKKFENLPLYKKDSSEINLSRKDYNKLNTFNIVYDKGNLFNIEGSLQYFIGGNLYFSLEAEYNHYNLDKFSEAYYLPKYKLEIDGNYKCLDEKLSLGTKIFMVGSRKANYFYYPSQDTNTTLIEAVRKLGSYIDLNLSASYKIKNNISVYLNGNNLFNKNYERFEGYKVLGAQVLGGVLFKF